VGELLNEVGALVTEDIEKVELLNAAFSSVFTAKAGPQVSQFPEIRDEACRKEDLPLVKEDCVRDHLRKLDTHGPQWDAPTSALSGQGPVQSAVGDPASAGGLD